MTNFTFGMLSRLFIVMAIGLAFSPLESYAEATPEPAAPPALMLEPVGQTGTYFAVEQKAGETATLTVALGNAGEAPIALRTFAADVYTLVNGGFGINSETEPATGTTTWLDYPADTLDLAPGKKIERTFTITVPEGTPAGQYITGLVLQTVEPIVIGESGMLRQIIAKAIAVFITVPGPLTPNLVIGEVSLAQTANSNSLEINIENSGNVLLKPSGIVTMTTADGKPVLTAPVGMGSVYAGMKTTLELPIPMILDPGTYTIAVALEDEETGVKAEAQAVSLTVNALEVVVITPVTISAVKLDPISDSATGNLQIVNVVVTLGNTGPAVPNARLTLRVLRDDELVEDFPLNSSLVVPQGSTEIQQRYLPLTGWTPGTYSFTVTLESVDANTGQITVLATADASTTVIVP